MSESSSRRRSRRRWLKSALAGSCALGSGCIGGDAGPQSGRLEKVWGLRGGTPGRLNKPRAIAIDQDDLLYIVDVTPRIQVFTPDGVYVRGWQTPDFQFGKPSGLSFDNSGNLLVADTHYYRILTYTRAGKLLAGRTIGGQWGPGPGQFHFVTDCAQDSQGNYYVSEYGEFDRIQKLSPDRKFLFQWGKHGNELGEFLRPQKLALDKRNHLWVADACNHRVQVFDATGSEPKLVASWGRQGHAPGELNYPYDIVLDEEGWAGQPDGHVYLCEYGNHRVQKFTLGGRFVGLFGSNGRRDGELDQPWGVARDSRGRMYVLDSYNHRVQRFRL
ncbi:MAG: NHL repeat-containing protein [Pirellulaceae bacterium]